MTSPSPDPIASILETVEAYTHLPGLIQAGEPLILGVSGGPDSMALAEIFVRLSERHRWKLTVSHVHHGLRGEESDAEQRLVERYCEKRNLPCEVLWIDPAMYHSRSKTSFQAQARKKRREWFEHLLGKLGARFIALGHQADDQAETILFRLLSGTSPTGAAGIRPIAPPYLHPLLCLTREDILTFLSATGTPYAQDSSNFLLKYDRNRVRNELLPFIRERFNPQVADALNRFAQVAQEEDALLESWAEEAEREGFSVREGRWQLDMEALHLRPLPIQRRLVRRVLFAINAGKEFRLQAHSVEAILDLSGKGPAGRQAVLPGGVVCERRESALWFFKPEKDAGAEIIIPEPGRWPCPEFGGALVIETCESSLPLENLESLETLWDAHFLEFPLILRASRPGDRIRKMGNAGQTKLAEVLRAHGLARGVRQEVPTLWMKKECLWIPGICRSFIAPISKETKQVYCIRWEKGEGQ